MPGRRFRTRTQPRAQGLRQLRQLLGPGWQQLGAPGTGLPQCVTYCKSFATSIDLSAASHEVRAEINSRDPRGHLFTLVDCTSRVSNWPDADERCSLLSNLVLKVELPNSKNARGLPLTEVKRARLVVHHTGRG